MTRSTTRRSLAHWLTRSLAVSLWIAALGIATFGLASPVPAQTPIKSRAYAPERVWELTTTEQRRVIEQEYSDQSGGRRIPEEQMRFYLDQVRLSNWTFSQIRRDITESLAGSGWGGQPQDQNNIRCESADNRARTCPTPWQGASRLVRQLSGTACIEGQNWWSSYGEVQVTGGCRAEFAAVRNDTPQGGEVRCESSDGRARTCPTPWPGASDLSYQLSSTPCIAGQNWSSSRGEVRVSGGCRAVFVQANYGSGQGEEIRCESADGRYRECGSGLRGRIMLIRQLSGTTCTEGVNWGVRNGTLWVNGGCRAVFQVSGGGWNEGYSVTCASENNRYTACAWDRNRGLPRLLETLSQARCTEGYSWGYDTRGGLWVNYGCRARFGVR